MKNLYGQRDAELLGEFYTRHIEAMTRECLHSKTDIAKELAYRDWKIAELEKRLTVKHWPNS